MTAGNRIASDHHRESAGDEIGRRGEYADMGLDAAQHNMFAPQVVDRRLHVRVASA